jgi:hypothetical protein
VVIAEYQRLPAIAQHNVQDTAVANDSAEIESLQLCDLDGQPTPPVRTGSPIALRIA